MAELVAGGVALRGQIDRRWPKRDKASDGWLGDAAHAARESDHNPDSKGVVHAIDVDEDLRGSKGDSLWLADQLIAYARMKRDGSNRLKNIVYEDRVSSGTYADRFWVWRDGEYGHTEHVHVSFSTVGEKNGKPFLLPIFDGEPGAWDGYAPPFDKLLADVKAGARTKATWRLACRLKEIGFFAGKVQPIGSQGYPGKAVAAMQEWMGWEPRPFDERVYRAVFRKEP